MAHEHQGSVPSLAHAGYLAVAANLYERQGDASTYTDIPKLVAELVSKVSDEQVYADLTPAWPGPPATAAIRPAWRSPASAGRPPDLDVCRAQPRP